MIQGPETHQDGRYFSVNVDLRGLYEAAAMESQEVLILNSQQWNHPVFSEAVTELHSNAIVNHGSDGRRYGLATYFSLHQAAPNSAPQNLAALLQKRGHRETVNRNRGDIDFIYIPSSDCCFEVQLNYRSATMALLTVDTSGIFDLSGLKAPARLPESEGDFELQLADYALLYEDVVASLCELAGVAEPANQVLLSLAAPESSTASVFPAPEKSDDKLAVFRDYLEDLL